jgi:signal transduction histidine kinase
MRLRLIAVAVAITSMVAVAFLVPLGILTSDLVADRERTAAERDAEFVARLSVLVAATDSSLGYADLVAEVGERAISIILPDGTTFGAPLDEGEDLAPVRGGATIRAQVDGGEAVYVPVITQNGTIVVRAVADADAMRSGVTRTWLILGAVGLTLVGIAVVVADRLGVSMVRPVRDLQRAVGRLGKGEVETEIAPSGPPEIQDVGRAFNRLAVQVDDLLRSEREDVADLAHRLRTPLTAARLAVEAGQKTAVVVDHLDNLRREIDHMIDEARRVDRRTTRGFADLSLVAAERATFWEPLAADEGRRFDVHIAASSPMVVAGADLDLAAAVDALVGNVFAHTSPGTAFSLTVEEVEGRAILTVEDDGPGFASSLMSDRGVSGAGSTGLGLDIVRRLAESCGGSISLASSRTGGGVVRVDIPIVQSP